MFLDQGKKVRSIELTGVQASQGQSKVFPPGLVQAVLLAPLPFRQKDANRIFDEALGVPLAGVAGVDTVAGEYLAGKREPEFFRQAQQHGPVIENETALVATDSIDSRSANQPAVGYVVAANE